MNRIPLYYELFNPTLAAIRDSGGSATNKEILVKIITSLQLPDDLVETLHSDKGNTTELEYRLGWAKTYIKIYGLITNSERGVWSLTPTGQSVVEVDSQQVVRFVRQEDIRRRQGQTSRITEDVNQIEPQDESNERASTWSDTLLDTLKQMPPDAFERLCQRVLRESGFIQVEVTGKSGDGGIDGKGIVQIAGLLSFPVIFQCKRYSSNVTAGIVRDFRGAMIGRADKGIIITTSGFTPDAVRESTRDGAPPIDLIDGEQLVNKLKELKLGVTTRQVVQELVEVNTEWFFSI